MKISHEKTNACGTDAIPCRTSRSARLATRPATSEIQKVVGAETRRTPRRGLNRTEAAIYVGVSPSKFDEMVKDGRMCSPKRIDGRVVWDIRQVDRAFDELPSDGDEIQNPWDLHDEGNCR